MPRRLNSLAVRLTPSLRAGRAAAWIGRVWSTVRPMSLEAFIGLLAAFAEAQQYQRLVEATARHPWLRRRARRALHAVPIDPDSVQAAELIAIGWMATALVDEGVVRQWLMPLLERSSDRYLPRMAIARFLVARLGDVRDPHAVVAAIETHVRPTSPTDYSNFRPAFSMRTWPLLRRCLTKPSLVSELDLFVTVTDRRAFWNELNQPGKPR